MQNYVTLSLETHLFFAKIMKKLSLFIRGYLDPSEEELIQASIILPLLADHVLREANHYLRILKTECYS